MEKLKEKLRGTVKDEVATYSILIAIFLTFIVTIGIYTFMQYKQSVATNSAWADNIKQAEEQNVETIENLTSVENVNSIEELQKLNEKESEEAKKKEEETKKNDTYPQYYIKVNYKAQVVTVYTKDSDGKYTKPVKAMVCSTGTYTPTSGVYKTPNKFRWLRMVGDVYSQYCTQIVGDILFHSVPYLRNGDHSSLEYWAYDKLGTKASLGCVRLTCQDAKWIYDNCKLGTQVEFYSSSDPGPLGKPSARKISDAPSYVRGWDPTDPASGNPWKKYLQEQAQNEDKDKNNTSSNTSNNTNSNTTKPTAPEKPSDNNANNTTNAIRNEVANETINAISEELENGTVNSVIISNEIIVNSI